MKLNLIILLALLATTFTVKAQEFIAEKDNTIYEESPSNSNGAGIYFFTGKTNQGNLRRCIVKFELPTADTNLVLVDVKVTLHCSKSRGNYEAFIHTALEDWGESTSDAGNPGGQGTSAAIGDATWATPFQGSPNQWNTGGGGQTGGYYNLTKLDSFAGSTGSDFVFDSPNLIPIISAMINTPATNLGFFITGEEPVSQSALRFNSRENSTNPPKLELTFCYKDLAHLSGDILTGEYNSVGELIIDGTVKSGSAVRATGATEVSIVSPFSTENNIEFEATIDVCP